MASTDGVASFSVLRPLLDLSFCCTTLGFAAEIAEGIRIFSTEDNHACRKLAATSMGLTLVSCESESAVQYTFWSSLISGTTHTYNQAGSS